MTIQDNYRDIFKDVQKIMCVFAHPDDAEIVCGGLISRLIADGKEVRLIVTTNGGKGMKNRRDLNEQKLQQIRIKEQKAAGKILGIKDSNNFNLNLADGEVEDTYENIGNIVFHVREFKPDLIITHNPENFIIDFFEKSKWVNHRDHRKTGSIVFDAAYPYSRDRGFYPEHFSESRLERHEVTRLLIADSYNHKDVQYFDISNFTEQKAKAIACHKSIIEEHTVFDYIDENRIGRRYFEPLRYIEIY